MIQDIFYLYGIVEIIFLISAAKRWFNNKGKIEGVDVPVEEIDTRAYIKNANKFHAALGLTSLIWCFIGIFTKLYGYFLFSFGLSIAVGLAYKKISQKQQLFLSLANIILKIIITSKILYIYFFTT